MVNFLYASRLIVQGSEMPQRSVPGPVLAKKNFFNELKESEQQGWQHL